MLNQQSKEEEAKREKAKQETQQQKEQQEKPPPKPGASAAPELAGITAAPDRNRRTRGHVGAASGAGPRERPWKETAPETLVKI